MKSNKFILINKLIFYGILLIFPYYINSSVSPRDVFARFTQSKKIQDSKLLAKQTLDNLDTDLIYLERQIDYAKACKVDDLFTELSYFNKIRFFDLIKDKEGIALIKRLNNIISCEVRYLIDSYGESVCELFVDNNNLLNILVSIIKNARKSILEDSNCAQKIILSDSDVNSLKIACELFNTAKDKNENMYFSNKFLSTIDELKIFANKQLQNLDSSLILDRIQSRINSNGAQNGDIFSYIMKHSSFNNIINLFRNIYYQKFCDQGKFDIVEYNKQINSVISEFAQIGQDYDKVRVNRVQDSFNCLLQMDKLVDASDVKLSQERANVRSITNKFSPKTQSSRLEKLPRSAVHAKTQAISGRGKLQLDDATKKMKSVQLEYDAILAKRNQQLTNFGNCLPVLLDQHNLSGDFKEFALLDQKTISEIFNRIEKDEKYNHQHYLKLLEMASNNKDYLLVKNLLYCFELYIIYKSMNNLINLAGVDFEFRVAYWIYSSINLKKDDLNIRCVLADPKNTALHRELDLLVAKVLAIECKNVKNLDALNKSRFKNQILDQKYIADQLNYLYLFISRHEISQELIEFFERHNILWVDCNNTKVAVPSCFKSLQKSLFSKLDFRKLFA